MNMNQFLGLLVFFAILLGLFVIGDIYADWYDEKHTEKENLKRKPFRR